jgi:hypothetical protein
MKTAALAALLVLAAAPAHAAQAKAFVFATDFGSGTIAQVGFGPPPAPAPNQALVCADAVLRHHQGLLYVIERFGCDNVRVLDPANGYAVVRQFSAGNGANPNDIVLVSPSKAYVTRYETAELWIVNPATGAFVGSVSLAAFADADGIPEMSRLAFRNGRVFVTVQRVDREAFFSPTDSSQVVVVDAAADTLVDCDRTAPGVQGILLPFQNPTTELRLDDDGDLVVGCTGFYGVADGGVVRIDPVALAVGGVETTEAALGGDLVDIAVAGAARGFAIVSDASFATACRPFDRGTGAAGAPVFATAGFHLADAEVNDRGELWLADRTPANPGVRRFDAATLAPLAGGVLSTGLPPQDIEFDGAATVGGPGAAAPAGTVTFAGAWPNPSRGSVVLRVRLAAGVTGAVRVTLVDAAGRRVRGLEAAAGPGGVALPWDGRDEAGRTVAPGVYGVRVEAGGAAAAGRVVRLAAGRL